MRRLPRPVCVTVGCFLRRFIRIDYARLIVLPTNRGVKPEAALELAVPRTRRFATGPAQGVATGCEIEAPLTALAPLLI